MAHIGDRSRGLGKTSRGQSLRYLLERDTLPAQDADRLGEIERGAPRPSAIHGHYRNRRTPKHERPRHVTGPLVA